AGKDNLLLEYDKMIAASLRHPQAMAIPTVESADESIREDEDIPIRIGREDEAIDVRDRPAVGSGGGANERKRLRFRVEHGQSPSRQADSTNGVEAELGLWGVDTPCPPLLSGGKIIAENFDPLGINHARRRRGVFANIDDFVLV